MAQGTITPFAGFNPEADSKKLREAMKGVGTNEKDIIDVICYRANAQRQEIKLKYKSMYGKELIADLKSELSGDFENTILALMMTPAEFDAFSVKKAVKGFGTNEAALIEVICTRTNEELTAAKESYKKMFKTEMEKDVADDTSGDFKRLMVACITAQREPKAPVDIDRATEDAKNLYEAGEKRWGTDESMFIQILATRNYAHLRAVFMEYPKISGHEIETAIEKETSGNFEKALLAIVKSVRSRSVYFAERLYHSMKGLGTDDETLIRVMVSRSEKDMVQIKMAFYNNYDKTLASFIKGDTSGDYEKALLAICRGE